MSDAEVRIAWRYGGEGTQPVAIPMSQLLRHTSIRGPSGDGKSYLALTLLVNLVARGVRCTVIDLKGELVALLLAHVLLIDARRRPRPDEVCALSPGAGYGLPLNPLVPIAGMPQATQAAAVVDLIDGLGAEPFGPRMSNVARWLVRAAMELHGSLLDVHRLLIDEDFAARVTEQVAEPDVRAYLRRTFSKERMESREALRARLENLLAIPAARQMLCAEGCVAPAELLRSRLTLVNLNIGGLGGTRAAKFIGNWVVTLLTGAIFARSSTEREPHSYVVIDEWQELAKVAADDLESILSKARSTAVSLTLINQYSAQVRSISPALWDGIRANTVLEVLFRPSAADLLGVESTLPVSGRMRDPARPDRMLSEAAERTRLQRFLKNLKPGEALLVNHHADTLAQVITTLNVPAGEALEAWRRLPPAVQEAWRRGKHGRRLEDLVPARIRLPEPGEGSAPAEAPPPARPTTGTPRFPRRAAKLVLK